jgi:hypothetical protein
MKSRSIFASLVILIFAGLVLTTATSAALVPEHGPSASGAGFFRFRNSAGQTEMWSFSFEATANKNGQTRGRAQFENLTTQTHIVVRINCLNVTSQFNSAYAVMVGRVLHSDDPNVPKLGKVLFAASDGPLPPVSSSDTITPPFDFPFTDHDCHDTQPLTVLPVDDGDIEIQP